MTEKSHDENRRSGKDRRAAERRARELAPPDGVERRKEIDRRSGKERRRRPG